MFDGNVIFVRGHFEDSLPKLREKLRQNSRRLAVLRADAEIYETLLDILYNLYVFVPVGGYFISDDCLSVPSTTQAIGDFRRNHQIREEEHRVDGSDNGTFWRKELRVDYASYNRRKRAPDRGRLRKK